MLLQYLLNFVNGKFSQINNHHNNNNKIIIIEIKITTKLVKFNLRKTGKWLKNNSQHHLTNNKIHCNDLQNNYNV